MNQFGQYRIEALIGSGATGEVYRARDERRDRTVALKLLPESLSAETEYREQFGHECQVLARLREPHVVPIHDFGELDGRLFIDMRLIDGQSLAALLAGTGRLAPDRTIGLLGQVAEALDAAHGAGLVHRAVRPSNILVDRSDFVYVVDFGVGHSRSRLSMTAPTVGALDYLAPERFENRSSDARSDTYSLACVLHECLTGSKPFPGDDLPALMYGHLHLRPPRPSEAVAELPPEIDEVIAKGMAKDPAERYGTAVEMLVAAHAALGLAAEPTTRIRKSTALGAPAAARPGRPEPVAAAPVAPVAEATPVPEPAPARAPVPEPAPEPAPETVPVMVGAAAQGFRDGPARHYGGDVPAWTDRGPAAGGPPPPAPLPPPLPDLPEPAPDRRRRGSMSIILLALLLVVATAGVTLLVVQRPWAADQAPTIAPAAQPAAPAPGPGVPVAPGAPVPVGAAPEPVGNSSATPTAGVTVPVGPTPGYMEIAPNGRYGYIANRAAGILTVFDTTINAVTGTIPVPDGGPQFVVFSPDGTRAYVSIFNSDFSINEVGVLDTANSAFVAKVPTGKRPFALDISPDGKTVYVPNHDSSSITVVDTATNTVRSTITVAPNPHWVDVSKDGKVLYAANHESNLLTIIDTATNATIATVPVGKSPHSILANPKTPLLYNVNYDDSSMSVTDLTTNTVIATVPTAPHPQDVSIAPDGKHGYLATVDDNAIQVFDTKTFAITARVPVGRSPTSIAVAPNGRQAYVTNLDDGTVTVLNIAGTA